MAQNRTRPTLQLAPGRRFSVFGFFGDVFGELRKVTWPTRQEAVRLWSLVIVLSAAMGVFLGFFDWAFARVLAMIAGN